MRDESANWSVNRHCCWRSNRACGGGKLFFTEKGDALYAISTERPCEDIRIKGVSVVKDVTLLGEDVKVAWREDGGGSRRNGSCRHAAQGASCLGVQGLRRWSVETALFQHAR